VVNHWHTARDAEETRDRIESLGCRCLVVESDVADPKACRAMIRRVETTFERLDILVHNASNFNQSPVSDVTEELWDSSINLNLKGPFFLSQAASRLMLKNHSGRIIAFIGNSFYENWPDFVPHAIAKTGLAKMMQGLAIAFSLDIQYSAICPASFLSSEGPQTETIAKSRGNVANARRLHTQGIDLYRGTPEDVAEMVVYLAGCSNYVNGAIIPLDGGKQAI
jgi:NAD(P)-dependent dehydrogenase (short-subunit alcohol dehydrogenase family)